MSEFDANMVRSTLLLLEGVRLRSSEAEALCRLVGSREEFLAHLLLRRAAFTRHSELVLAIKQAAIANTTEHSTKRPDQADVVRARAAYNELEAALLALIAHDKQARELYANLEAAQAKFLRYTKEIAKAMSVTDVV